MPIFQTRQQLSEHLAQQRDASLSIGLVPTMGALHDGHLALVKKCLAENDTVVVSIFVNPTQFNSAEDLEKYPRGLESDLKLLDTVSSEIVVFAPTVEAIYGDQPKSQEYEFDGLDKVMEGAFRPGHFNGVGTIVELLLRAVAPHSAYFGEKDFQQLAVIRAMTRDLDLTQPHVHQLIGVPTVREADGLAMSSRNRYLSPDDRTAAATLPAAMKRAIAAIEGGGDEASARSGLQAALLSAGFASVDYAALADARSLEPIDALDGKPARLLVAARIGGTRLIDNMAVG